MNELQPLVYKLEKLTANASPQARARLARKIKTPLVQSQRLRIAQQKNTDGSSYEPRKIQRVAKRKKGKIKTGAMFKRLKMAQNMQMIANADGVEIGFKGRIARIAEVHHFGLVDKVNPRVSVKYAARELLGLTQADNELIENLVLEHLGDV